VNLSRARILHKRRRLLFDRQRRLLTLLEAVGGRVGNLDFQKLLFLYCQEPEISSPYEFVPYKFGAFSFTSYADRQKLVERGYLESEESSWRLTTKGRKATRETDLLLSAFADRHKGLRGDALVAETYRRFPYYATRSEIAERVLRSDPDALKRIESARPGPRIAALSTIGYEGKTLERFLNELLASNVAILCDLRRNPLSRKYGFSKGTLSRACEALGIRYEHLPELGIASEQRRSLETQADYDALFATYERKSLPKQGEALSRLKRWIESGEHIALTCYERLPQQCHRHCVAEVLEHNRHGITAKHL
jgi:uncharacterized protein (DUF488 family)